MFHNVKLIVFNFLSVRFFAFMQVTRRLIIFHRPSCHETITISYPILATLEQNKIAAIMKLIRNNRFNLPIYIPFSNSSSQFHLFCKSLPRVNNLFVNLICQFLFIKINQNFSFVSKTFLFLVPKEITLKIHLICMLLLSF